MLEKQSVHHQFTRPEHRCGKALVLIEIPSQNDFIENREVWKNRQISSTLTRIHQSWLVILTLDTLGGRNDGSFVCGRKKSKVWKWFVPWMPNFHFPQKVYDECAEFSAKQKKILHLDWKSKHKRCDHARRSNLNVMWRDISTKETNWMKMGKSWWWKTCLQKLLFWWTDASAEKVGDMQVNNTTMFQVIPCGLSNYRRMKLLRVSAELLIKSSSILFATGRSHVLADQTNIPIRNLNSCKMFFNRLRGFFICQFFPSVFKFNESSEFSWEGKLFEFMNGWMFSALTD